MRVIDHGPGIPTRPARPRLRDRSSNSATSTPASGVGLGLAVAKGFLDAVGVTAHRRRDPRRRTHHAHRPARRHHTRARLHRRRPVTSVLVIDDEAALLRALRINLTARDYTVTTAADGGAGLAAMARDRPDVVIVDLGLPDMDGTEVIRGIRGWSTSPDHRAIRARPGSTESRRPRRRRR